MHNCIFRRELTTNERRKKEIKRDANYWKNVLLHLRPDNAMKAGLAIKVAETTTPDAEA
jgi:hypothetical protein